LIARTLKLDCSLNDKVVDMVHQVENTGKFYSPENVKKELLAHFKIVEQ